MDVFAKLEFVEVCNYEKGINYSRRIYFTYYSNTYCENFIRNIF